MKATLFLKWTLFCLACLAGPWPKAVGAEEEFRLVTETLEIPERGVVTVYVLLAEGHRFSFLPPTRWSVRPDAPKKAVHLLPEDLRAGISFKIQAGQNGAKPELNPRQLREQLLERYPQARISDEFKCYAGGSEGVAFDIERMVGQETSASSRLAFVAFKGGTVEFELTANTSRFADYHLSFGRLLSSFRIDPPTTK
ncbi:MAG: hypothetical protein DME19_01345 [Verrucomicrobia bacterium]|nr:MAG: hypothetical protein DME19_01345 [Verrucomicrobiota bacterium]